MTVLTIVLVMVIVFLLGFEFGKIYIVKGLALRVEQLVEEGDDQLARAIERMLEEQDKK